MMGINLQGLIGGMEIDDLTRKENKLKLNIIPYDLLLDPYDIVCNYANILNVKVKCSVFRA